MQVKDDESQEANCNISLNNSNTEDWIKKSTVSCNMKEKGSLDMDSDIWSN